VAAAKDALENAAIVAGTKQNLSNLYSLDIYV
jgi:precorrin-6B methylase 1